MDKLRYGYRRSHRKNNRPPFYSFQVEFIFFNLFFIKKVG